MPVHLEPRITYTLVKAGSLSCFYDPPLCYCAGIFAFKCSRAEEIFNLLQDLMQCNSINVVEEPVVITRNSHPTERELSRTPQAPNSKALSVSGEKRGEHRDVGDTCSHLYETALCSPWIPPMRCLAADPYLYVHVCSMQHVYFKALLVCDVVFCFQGNSNKKPFK